MCHARLDRTVVRCDRGWSTRMEQVIGRAGGASWYETDDWTRVRQLVEFRDRGSERGPIGERVRSAMGAMRSGARRRVCVVGLASGRAQLAASTRVHQRQREGESRGSGVQGSASRWAARARTKSRVRCRPIHTVLLPGWPSCLRLRKPPNPASMRTIMSSGGGSAGGFARRLTM